jgi:hypothetical protein
LFCFVWAANNTLLTNFIFKLQVKHVRPK